MKNAIFLCESAGNIMRVFGEDVRELLPIGEKVYSKADVMSSKGEFCNTEFIFSTWGMPAFTEEEIKEIFPSLRAVFYAAGSVQAFAAPFLACGVKVFSAWRANAIPVAEYALAQILLANKGFYLSSAAYSVGDLKSAGRISSRYKGNYGTTVGIIGVGMIGRMLIKLLKPFHVNVVAFDAFLSAERISEIGAEKVGLNELFERSNVISNHLADNEQTRGMIGYEQFSLMPENATFINTGRGAQVKEDDLVRILGEREDLLAILDVTYPEPVEPGHEFFSLENCILTPHIAGSNGNEVRRMGEYMYKAYNDLLSSVASDCEVSAEMLKTMA